MLLLLLMETLLLLMPSLLPLPVLAAFAGLDGAGGKVGFALGFVVVEGDDDVGEEDDVGDNSGGGAGVG